MKTTRITTTKYDNDRELVRQHLERRQQALRDADDCSIEELEAASDILDRHIVREFKSAVSEVAELPLLDESKRTI